MANFASTIGTATGISDVNANFTIRFQNSSRGIDISLNWSCKTVRSAAYQYAQGVNIPSQASNALAAVSADLANHPTLKLYVQGATISNGFKAEAKEYGWIITNTFNSLTTNFTFSDVTEVLPAKNFQLTGYSLSSGAIPCSQVLVTLTQNGDGVAPFTWVTPSSASTNLSANVARQSTNQTITVTIQDSETDQSSLSDVFIPRLLTSAEISNISVVTNAGGLDATVTIFTATTGSEFGGYQYSLDGTNFQSSNVFTGVTAGTKTLYLKEGLGCQTSTSFDVTLTAGPGLDPYAVVPKANPMRMIRQTTYKYNTLENTLYHYEDYLGENNPFYAQPYENSDGVIVTQFHTNYDTIIANILDCENNIIRSLTPQRKTNNIGLSDKRDAIAYNKGNNQTGIYFTTGNVYDPVTDDVIDIYSLNGQLPEYGIIGNTLTLSGALAGSYIIKQVVYDANLQARILVIDYVWTSANSSEAIIVTCNYNRQPYETYEFYVDLGETPFLNGVYYNQLLLTDSGGTYPGLVFNSELYYVKETHKRTNFVQYYNSDDSGIDYSTGYVGAIRLKSLDPYNKISPAGELSNYEDTNNELTLLNSRTAIDGTMFIQEVPRYMVEKLRLIIGHEEIYINGEKWSANEGIEVQDFDKYSLRNVNIKFRRNNYNEYNTNNIELDGPRGAILTGDDIPILL